jgi:cytoskeletal protein RodZ
MSTTLDRIIQRRRPELKKKEKEAEKGVSWTRTLFVVAFVIILVIVGLFLYYYWWKPSSASEEESIVDQVKRMESNSQSYSIQTDFGGQEDFREAYPPRSKPDL